MNGDSCLIPQSSFPELKFAATSAHQGRHLPRWEAAGAIYHITLHLADSVPTDQLRFWKDARIQLKELLLRENRRATDDEYAELKALYNERIEKYLAAGHGACFLKNPTIQTRIREILLSKNGIDYALHAWCIMPNHLHIIVGSFREGCSMTTTLSSWKRISGHFINKISGLHGSVWQADGYTRIIRDADEYRNQLTYVWNNPETAGLTAGFLREKYV